MMNAVLCESQSEEMYCLGLVGFPQAMLTERLSLL